MLRKLLAATALSASLALAAPPAVAAPADDALFCIDFYYEINGTPIVYTICFPIAEPGAAAS